MQEEKSQRDMHDVRDQLEILMGKLTIMRDKGLSVETRNAYQRRLEEHLRYRDNMVSSITIILQSIDTVEDIVNSVDMSTADLLDDATVLAKVKAREELESQYCFGLHELNQLRHTLEELSKEKEQVLTETQYLRDDSEKLKSSTIQEMDNAISRMTLTLADLVSQIELEMQQHQQSERDILRSIEAKKVECSEVTVKSEAYKAELENLLLKMSDMKSKVLETQQAVLKETLRLESLQEDANSLEKCMQSLLSEEVSLYSPRSEVYDM